MDLSRRFHRPRSARNEPGLQPVVRNRVERDQVQKRPTRVDQTVEPGRLEAQLGKVLGTLVGIDLAQLFLDPRGYREQLGGSDPFPKARHGVAFSSRVILGDVGDEQHGFRRQKPLPDGYAGRVIIAIGFGQRGALVEMLPGGLKEGHESLAFG